MAITPRSKGLGNIGAIVDRQGRASVAAPKAPVKPVVKAAPRPAPRPAPKPVARVAPKPAPKMAPVSKPSPFAKKPDTRAPGGGGMDINGNPIGGGMGAQMNFAGPNLARNTGPIAGAAPRPGDLYRGGPSNQPGAPIDYLGELNKNAGWGTSNGTGNFAPAKRMEDASENYFKSVIDAAGGYDQYKAKNPGKDVFSISEDFKRLNPEQQYGYLSYNSPENSPSNRAPVGTPPPKSIYDQFGIPRIASPEPYMEPVMNPAYSYGNPDQFQADFGGQQALGLPQPGQASQNTGMFAEGATPEYYTGGPAQTFGGQQALGQGIGGMGMSYTNPYGLGDYGGEPTRGIDSYGMPPYGVGGPPMPMNPGTPSDPFLGNITNAITLFPNGYNLDGQPNPDPYGTSFQNMNPVGMPDMTGGFGGEPEPYGPSFLNRSQVFNQRNRLGTQPRPTMTSAFSPVDDNDYGAGFMSGSGSLFGGGGFAGK